MGVLDLGAHLSPSPQFCRALCHHGRSTDCAPSGSQYAMLPWTRGGSHDHVL